MQQNENNYINPVGYSEMYEWAEMPANSPHGLFVTFDTQNPDKITTIKDATSKDLLGVTTIQSVETSDDPNNWKYAYLCNEVGDKFLKNDKIAVGVKEYDQVEEFSYIHTRPYNHYIQVPSKYYDPKQQYAKRSSRKEWVRVNLIGKVIVRDNGECKPGEYCQPYAPSTKSKKNRGYAIPADMNMPGWKFYITQRITDTTIEIVMSPTMNKYIDTKDNG